MKKHIKVNKAKFTEFLAGVVSLIIVEGAFLALLLKL
jgi:hypothetical protein